MKRLFTGFLLLILLPSTALGISGNDQHSVLYDTTFFDPNGSCTVDLSVTLSGNDNVQKAFNFVLSKQLTPAQAAGMVANLYRESGVTPTAQQDKSTDPLPKDGVGFGIAQWTFSDRQQPLVQLAKQDNQPVTSLALQLEYFWDELNGIAPANHEGGLSEVKATSTPQDAAIAFMNAYERPKFPQTEGPLRSSLALQILRRYGGGPTGTTATAPASSDTGCSGVVGNGQNTRFIDGFTLYAQYDPAWKDKPYGSSTIGVAGCGPTAMAMIITNLTGQQITPVQAANYADSNGDYVAGAGSSWSIGPDLAKHWGLNATPVGADVAKITAALQAGALVITAGQGALPFSQNGHFIVIRGVTADGKWKIGDPGHSGTSDQAWSPNQLITQMHDGSVYAISK